LKERENFFRREGEGIWGGESNISSGIELKKYVK
jgi:hypothetical protein